jgi:glyoxylase-like metal-dependent hydrolase (beta-lactamase superfamily II)
MKQGLLVAAVATCIAIVSAQSPTLDIYVVDVEGGNATLFVAPSGESLLIDTGNGGAAAVRDAERIMAAATDAALVRIDHLITTHYHGDHFGALRELAGRIPRRDARRRDPHRRIGRGGRPRGGPRRRAGESALRRASG